MENTGRFGTRALTLYGLCLFACGALFSVTVVEAGLFFVLAVLVFEKYREKDLAYFGRGLRANPLFKPWLVYLAVCLLTGLLAFNLKKGVGYFPSDLVKYICFSVLCLALRPGNLPAVSAFYAGAAALSAAAGISEALWGYVLHSDFHIRAGAFANPVRYGEMMVIAFTFVLSRVLAAPPERKVEKILYYGALALIPLAIAFSQTRGAYLGLIITVAGILVFEKAARKKLAPWLAVFAAAALALMMLNPAVRYRVTSIADGVRNAASVQSAQPVTPGHTADLTALATNIRLELWKVGFRLFKDHPLFGIGPANVGVVFKTYHPARLGELDNYGSLHNLYIHQLAERGILGLAALLFLFGSMFLLALKNFRASANPYTLWALALLPAYFAMNFTEISFQHVHTSFAVFLALAASYNSIQGTDA